MGLSRAWREPHRCPVIIFNFFALIYVVLSNLLELDSHSYLCQSNVLPNRIDGIIPWANTSQGMDISYTRSSSFVFMGPSRAR